MANSIRKTCYKCVINNLIEGKYNNLITILIINIKAKFSTHMKDSLTICQYQIDKFDYSNIDNIDQISIALIIFWKEIICCSGQLIEITTDMKEGQF